MLLSSMYTKNTFLRFLIKCFLFNIQILEVSPATTQELLPGTRLCAYWSQQYRCLYPGTVAEPGTPDPTLDDRFVCVEFDDGDSGRIALEDIRLLQADYPIVGKYNYILKSSISLYLLRGSPREAIEFRRGQNPELLCRNLSQDLLET